MKIQLPTRNQSGLAARWLVLIVSAAGLFANAQSTDDATTTSFETFQVIVQRNIFNPDRYGGSNYSYQRHPEVPTFALAGTMSYRKGMFAFFSGTSDEYRKALQEGGTVAGYTVTHITFDGAELKNGEKTIELKVGAAMRLEDGSWTLSAPGEWENSSSSETDNQNTNGVPAAPLPSSGEQNDVLKRLMQRREQEQK